MFMEITCGKEISDIPYVAVFRQVIGKVKAERFSDLDVFIPFSLFLQQTGETEKFTMRGVGRSGSSRKTKNGGAL